MSGPTEIARPDESPLSLRRLRDAFAAMLQPRDDCAQEANADSRPCELRSAGVHQASCDANPRSIVEAMLFVGRPDDGAMSARELAAAMRGVSPTEVDTVVADLNRSYERDGSPYSAVGSPQGYRLALRAEFHRQRDKYLGRMREARLTRGALEVLAVIAYNQPVSADAIHQIRGRPNGAVLATLVRRRLVRLEQPAEGTEKVQYVTTERFLRLFGLESLAALPRSEDLETH